MLKEEDLVAWFASQGITTPISYDVLPDEAPANVSAISISGGLGLSLEHHFDRPTFSVLTRAGGSQAGLTARNNAIAIDEAFLNAESNFQLGDYWVVGKGRFGGPPAYVATDEKNRVLRSATYWMQIER
jgi:hypothetical protein